MQVSKPKTCLAITLLCGLMFAGRVLAAVETPDVMQAAATVLSIDAFLQTAQKDYRLANQREIVEYLAQAETSTPYLDKIELRTQTEQFDEEKQKYSLRFYPKGWGETEAGRKLMRAMRQANTVENERYFAIALKQRYDLILAYLENVALTKLYEERLTVCQDRIDVLQKMNGNRLNVDMDALLSAEDAFTDIHLEIIKLENRMTGLRHKIGVAAGMQARIEFDKNSLIDIDGIEKALDEPATDNLSQNPYLRERQSKIELAQCKYELEKAKNRDYLSFIDLSYDRNDSDDPEKACSVEIGFKLPFIQSDQEAVHRRKYSCLKARLAYEEEKQRLTEEAASQARGIERLISQYRLLTEREQEGRAKRSLETFLHMEGANPLNLLTLKEKMIDHNIRMTRITYRIRSRFIDLLDNEALLGRQPLINHLATDGETFNGD